jgi:hypothetical protein
VRQGLANAIWSAVRAACRLALKVEPPTPTCPDCGWQKRRNGRCDVCDGAWEEQAKFTSAYDDGYLAGSRVHEGV